MDIFGSLPDAGMSAPALAGILAVLALIDSTSFGTLLIPVWLMLAPGRVRPGRVLIFLGTVAGFYLLVGIAVMLGADAFLAAFGDVLAGRPMAVVMVVVGAALVIGSFAIDSPSAKRRAAEQAATGGGRIGRWRARAMGTGPQDSSPDAGARVPGSAGAGHVVPESTGPGNVVRNGMAPAPSSAPGRVTATHPQQARPALTEPAAVRGSVAPLMGLALGAAAIEVASMLPYLAGIGLISSEGPGWPGSVLWLAAYCVVMIAPALVLLAGRVFAARLLDGPLHRLDAFLTRTSASTTAWVVGIVGAILALNGLVALNG
ncbi:MAG: GAP family protein [Actinomycetaceae bacterium]